MKKITIKKSIVIPVSIVAIAIILFIILINGGRGIQSQKLQEKTWTVATMKIQQGDFSPNLVLHGNTESPRHAQIEAAINADVKDVHFFEGNFVKKDEVLIQLDDREANYNLKQKNADMKELDAQVSSEKIRQQFDMESLKHEKTLVEISQRSVKRHQQSVDEEVGSEAVLDQEIEKLREDELAVTARQLMLKNHKARMDQLLAKLQSAQALENQAKLDLARTQIKAPFDGRITDLHASIGDRVQAGEKLLELYDTSLVEIRSQVPSQYVGIIHTALADKVKLTATANIDNRETKLTLNRLAGEVAMGRGGVDALFRVSNSHRPLSLGRSLELILSLPQQKNVFKIPSNALYGNDKVFTIENNRMKAIKVARLGIIHNARGGNELLIQSPKLKNNMTIITTQLPNARDGLKVEEPPAKNK